MKLRRYKIKVNEVKTTEFELNARNKNVAKEIVKEIILNTQILNLKCVGHDTTYVFDIEKVRGAKK